MGKKTKKPGKGKEKTEKNTTKAEEKKARRETKKLSLEDDIDAILVNYYQNSIPLLSPFGFSTTGAPLQGFSPLHIGVGATHFVAQLTPNVRWRKALESLIIFPLDGQKDEKRKDGLNINPLKETELILCGDEFYNGSKTFVYGDLYQYNVEKREWKLVSSPNSPPPRSVHQKMGFR